MKNSFFNNLCTLVSVCMIGFVFANPEFDTDGDGQFDDLGDFLNDANITAIVGDGIGVVGQDYIVAHVNGEIRGVGIASSIPFGSYAGGVIYLTTYGSYEGGSVDSPGEAISFYFYDGATGDTTPMTETINFITDGSDGNYNSPFLFTEGTSYPTAPACEDIGLFGGAMTCAASVGYCGTIFGGTEDVDALCPVTCDACPDYTEGCMDPDAAN